jgi:hypothetical protein
MLDVLNGLWIINPNGLCLLHRNFEETQQQIDETMFSGFLTAILSFTQDLVKDSIEKISMGERDIYYSSFGQFAVALSANKSKKAKNLQQYINKVGELFLAEFGDHLRSTNITDISVFEDFGPKIDGVFGITGHAITASKNELLDILTKLKNGQMDEKESIERILASYNSLDDKNKKFMKGALKDVEDIFKKSSILSEDQRKQFQSIVKEVGAQLKAEKWLSSF